VPGSKPCPFDDPDSLRGLAPEEVEELIPDHWIQERARSDRGWRYSDPDHPGHQVRIMEGNPRDPDPVKRGPYLRVSMRGKTCDPVPLKGNPVLR